MKTIGIALVILGTAAAAQPRLSQDALSTMLATDRAFDELSGQQGVSAAFLEYLADSSIVFRPGPVSGKSWIRDHPTPAGNSLRWQPVMGEVASAGDLGYTVGVYTSRRRRGDSVIAGHGVYLSVWNRGPDGVWRAVVDGGIGGLSQADIRDTLWIPVMRSALPASKFFHDASSALLEQLRAYDMRYDSLLNDGGPEAAVSLIRTGSALVLRNNRRPLSRTAEILNVLKKHGVTTVISGRVALGGDLGYTYGSYSLMSMGGTESRAYYVHVWRRLADGQWELVVDLEMS